MALVTHNIYIYVFQRILLNCSDCQVIISDTDMFEKFQCRLEAGVDKCVEHPSESAPVVSTIMAMHPVRPRVPAIPLFLPLP